MTVLRKFHYMLKSEVLTRHINL